MSEKELDARIEKLRKGDLEVRFPGGESPAGEVRYELIRHHFPFGTTVNARLLLDDPVKNQNARRYQETLRLRFNCAVAENAHKWYAMEQEQGKPRDDEALKVWQRCRELGLEMRGHCVYWGIERYVMPWLKTLDRPALEAAMKSRAGRVLTLFKDRISEWDLNNEMLHGDYYAKVLGLKNGAVYFKWCKEAAPGVIFYVNDYNVLQGGSVDRYVAHIRELIEAGAQVGGIGDQAHFSGRVPPSAQVWSILDKLGQFKLPVKITEFDIKTKDEQRQAEDTRRFYKLCFAHPAVAGILMWGFWEGAHWIPEAALWRKDWSLKPNGEAYLKLMEEWRTKGEAATEQGALKFRGFHGTYRLESGGRAWRVTLVPGGPSAEAVSEPAGGGAKRPEALGLRLNGGEQRR